MHINVRDILQGEVGASANFSIEDEQPELPDLDLTEPINGEVKVTHTHDGLAVRGNAHTALRLECHRCLSAFVRPSEVSLTGEFRDEPAEDQWPIDGETIDLAQMIRAELLVDLPIKLLCEPDCPGLCPDCGERLTQPHKH